MAEDLDFEQTYKQVFGLYGLSWDHQLDDIILNMK